MDVRVRPFSRRVLSRVPAPLKLRQYPLLSHAAYWIGPIVGAVIAAVIWKWLTTEESA